MKTCFVIKMEDGYLVDVNRRGLIVSASAVEAKEYKTITNAMKFGKKYKALEVVEVTKDHRRKAVNVIRLHK